MNIRRSILVIIGVFIFFSGCKTTVNGSVEMNADTKITVLYTSSIQETGTQLNYIISASISSNDKVTTPTGGI